MSTDSSGPDAYPSRGGIATGEVAEELVLSLEPAGSAEDSTAVLPEHGKMVLATPQMQAPQIQSRYAPLPLFPEQHEQLVLFLAGFIVQDGMGPQAVPRML